VASAADAQTVPYTAPERFTVGRGLGQAEMPRGSLLRPRLEGAIQYVQNLRLAEDGDPQIDTFGLEVAPGIYASYSSEAFTGAMDYSLIGRLWDESDFNDIAHRLAANGEWFAVPEWLSLRGQASYRASVIDPLISANYGRLGIFDPANSLDVAAASISPVLSHRFNHFVVSAQYSYGRTWFLDSGDSPVGPGFVYRRDSQDQSAGFSLGRAPDAGRLSASLYYDWQRSEYDQAIPFEYERAGVSLGYPIGREFWIIGDYGLESDLTETTTQGGLDSEFWSAGLRWEPRPGTSMEARVGDRFFGESYSFSLRHRARMLELSAAYSEQPTVQTRELSLGDFDPGDLPPGGPDVDFGRFNSEPFVSKAGSATIGLLGSRTEVRLHGFYSERDYIRETPGFGRDETSQGAVLAGTRRLAANMSLDASISYREEERAVMSSDPEQGDLTIKTYDTQATFRLNRETTPRLVLSAEAGWLNRSGARNYDGLWIGLRGRWSPYATETER